MLGAGLIAVPAVSVQAVTTATAVRSVARPHPAVRPASVLNVKAGNNSGGVMTFFRLSTHRLAAGLVRVNMRNTGSFPHQLQLLRLHRGITPAAYLRALTASHGGSTFMLADATGGPNAVNAGGHQTVWLNLRPGKYVAACFETGGDHNAPHFVTGMFASLTVVGRSRPAAAPAGRVQGNLYAYTIEYPYGSTGPLMGYIMPRVINGHGLYEFRNLAGTDSHEFTIVKLAPGKTALDVVNFIKSGTGPVPMVGDFGGGGALAPGGHMWIRMNLPPGHYAAVCFIPDDMAPHMPHVAMGMARSFTVK